jgi:hypothetical protein
MRRLYAVAFALGVGLCLGTGCASDADRKQWAEALKDLRGDNMEMGSHSHTPPEAPH